MMQYEPMHPKFCAGPPKVWAKFFLPWVRLTSVQHFHWFFSLFHRGIKICKQPLREIMSSAGIVSHACRNPMCPKASTKRYKSERALVLHMTQFPQCEAFSRSMISDGTGGWESSNRHTTTALKASVDLRRDYLNPYDHHLHGNINEWLRTRSHVFAP